MYEAVSPRDPVLSLREIIRYCDEYPEVAAVNRGAGAVRAQPPTRGAGPAEVDMKVDHVLIVGLGSMGKRRVRNLQRLGVRRITGFDPREDRRREAIDVYSIETVDDMERAWSVPPDAVVISTPPDLHVRYAREAVRHRTPFFMEASVVDDDMEALAREADAFGVVAAPSCTMRFQPSIRTIKRLVDEGRIGQILAFTHHSGQYLPDWHPWEDYRRFYAGQRRTGACREIVPFELVWLTWIAGPVAAITAFKGKVSDLDVDIDDVYQVLLRHESGTLGHLLVDVLARAPVRRCTFVGSEGTLIWDWSARCVLMYDAREGASTTFEEEQGTVQPGYVHAEEPYVEEMRAYLTAVSGEAPWPYPLSEDMRMLALLTAAERSSDDGRRVDTR